MFSDRCKFKDLRVSEDRSYRVSKLADLSLTIEQLMNQTGKEDFSPIEVERLYERLFAFSQADQVTKERHENTLSQGARNH